MFETTAYINGNIYTMEKEGERCSAFAVRDGKFIYCGSDEEALKLADKVVDLEGKTVLPGLIDTHQHLYAYSRNLSRLDLSGITSLADLKEVIRKHSKDLPAGEWLIGTGYDNERFTDCKDIPARWDLDEACPDNPVLLTRCCMHWFSLNSMALEMSGIGKGYKPKVEGTVRFTESGEPTGAVADAVGADILAAIPDAAGGFEAKLDSLERGCRLLSSHGLTGVHPIRAKHCDLPESMDLYQALNEQGRLPLRVYVNFDDMPGLGIVRGLGDEMVRYGFFKMYLDGNLGGRSAALKEPYSDDPSNTGVINYTQKEVTDSIREAFRRGLQVGVHVIGDRAAEMLVNALETVCDEYPDMDARFRVIHAAVLSEELMDRLAKLPVIMDVQPLFIPADMPWLVSRLGSERSKYVYCWKSMACRGLMLTSGSDNPYGSYDPFEGVYASVTRLDMEGSAAWYPEESISVYEALRMLTWNAAYASFEEDIKGTVKAGKLADFIIIDRDIFRIDPKEIKDIKVEKTYLGGKTVYERK